MSTVIKVENLSKQYRLGLVGASTFKEDTQRWWAKMRGKVDPFLTLGSENDRTFKDDSKFVWSLKDINFDVEQGDVLGIVGSNGAGKSTLLKILSKVTAPTTGSVKVKGRIASLLEVGTGFHPELTGRENIYLNGAILGMRKHEIKRKLDEIISFAGVEKYVDTPVKRYSSGMYVRLAFAVAAHLESEILIVDEALAVGDSDFQNKCLGKMGDISKTDGRTILFVSHNTSAIQSMCSKGILLNNGLITSVGNIRNVLTDYYLRKNNKIDFFDSNYHRGENKFSYIRDFIITSNIIDIGSNLNLEIEFEIKYEIIHNIEIGVTLTNYFDVPLSYFVSSWEAGLLTLNKGIYRMSIFIHNLTHLPGNFYLSPWILEKGNPADDHIPNAVNFEITHKLDLIKGVKIDEYNSSGSEVYYKSDWDFL
jgi:lipopolysaccharide transport system ATP-binding protein